jgi:hypothetical protein
MSHDPHEALFGYNAGQIFVDGCSECTHRVNGLDSGIGSLDSEAFARAWERATAWNRGQASRVARIELRPLSALLEVQFQLERRGIPIGEVPHG